MPTIMFLREDESAIGTKYQIDTLADACFDPHLVKKAQLV